MGNDRYFIKYPCVYAKKTLRYGREKGNIETDLL